jgi:hypothetical protein
LETKASVDGYTFTVPPGGQSLYIDWATCAGGRTYSFQAAAWRLVSAGTGQAVASGTQCVDRRVDGLAPGEYRFEVSVAEEGAGAYALELFAVPAT